MISYIKWMWSGIKIRHKEYSKQRLISKALKTERGQKMFIDAFFKNPIRKKSLRGKNE